jgi:phosphate transport system substrate-binding protein
MISDRYMNSQFRYVRMVVGCALLVALPAMAELIRVGGTGSASPLMQDLAAAYRKLQPNDEVSVMHPPPSSGGGVRMLVSGKLDLALSGRPLKPEEQAQVGLVFLYAKTPLVIAGKTGTRKAGFSISEIADLYAGRLTRWDDGSLIRLILRSPTESDTLQLRNLSPLVDEALQLALMRPGMAYAENDLDAVELLTKTPSSVGTTTLGLLKMGNHSLQLYPLAGILPTVKNLAEGKYPLSKSIFIVSGRQPSESAKRFTAFLRTTQARDILRQTDYLPQQ